MNFVQITYNFVQKCMEILRRSLMVFAKSTSFVRYKHPLVKRIVTSRIWCCREKLRARSAIFAVARAGKNDGNERWNLPHRHSLLSTCLYTAKAVCGVVLYRAGAPEKPHGRTNRVSRRINAHYAAQQENTHGRQLRLLKILRKYSTAASCSLLAVDHH